ncbi:methyl-accepting chemotaxis protein [Gammaproteobacteria bacterium]
MKLNHPVTQIEKKVPYGAVLVSKTDLKGRMTYTNREFVEQSGFTEQELLGASHNIVRHPDVPPQVFEDLWRTLQMGRPWNGIVKNRVKTGDHYWVEANVTPLLEQGQVVGYLSVRQGATPEQIQAAEALYAGVASGKIRLGRKGPLERLNPLPYLRLWQQLVLLILALLLPFGLQVGVYLQKAWQEVVQVSDERDGLRFLQPLRDMLVYVARHRGSSSGFLNGDPSFEGKMLQMQADIETVLRGNVAQDITLQTRFDVREPWEEIVREWTTLKGQVTRLAAPESFRRHTLITEKLLALMDRLANRSRLILDPEPQGYYLVDAAFNDLIVATERMGQLRAKGTGHAIQRSISGEEHSDITARTRQVQNRLDLTISRLNYAFESNPGIRQALAGPLEDFNRSTHALVTLIQEGILNPQGIRADPKDYFERATLAIDKGFVLFDQISNRIGQILDDRYQVLWQRLWREMGIVLFCLLAALRLGVVIIRRLTRPMANAIQVFDRMTQNDYYTPIGLSSRRDEMGELLLELKKMQVRLGFEMVDSREKAAAATRIRQALDGAGAATTVSNADGDLIYYNQAARRLFQSMAPVVATHCPGFDPDEMLGTRVSRVFSDPSLIAIYAQPLERESHFRTQVGGFTLDLAVAPVHDEQGHYMGRVTQWTDQTERLAGEEAERQRVIEERHVAATNLRLKVALDNVASRVMVSDAEHQIIYMNEAATTLFRAAETDIRREIPGFAVDRIVGSSIDQFHKNPHHQRNLLSRLTGTHRSGFLVGGHTMDFLANPVVDSEGRRLGTVVEWNDRTLEVAVEKEIGAIVNAARRGDLSQRVALQGKQGFFKSLTEGINELIGIVEAVIREIAEVMGQVSEGDLTRQMTAQHQGAFGQIRDNINQTLDNLKGIVGNLLESADTVATAANEISAGNNNLSARTEQQASSLQQTASSMEQLASVVRNNAGNAQEANQVATHARQMAERGGRVVSDAIQAMDAIHQASRQIAEIIGVIDEIAFQTNLLALNASVEAARAGEQGRGFAVVASEVRNLASRSAAAAKSIKELIRDSVEKVETGARLVDESGATLQEIVASVQKVGHLIAEIAQASREQTAGIDQINQAVVQMDEMTQQNAALAEETSSASAHLSEQALGMKEQVTYFLT